MIGCKVFCNNLMDFFILNYINISLIICKYMFMCGIYMIVLV